MQNVLHNATKKSKFKVGVWCFIDIEFCISYFCDLVLLCAKNLPLLKKTISLSVHATLGCEKASTKKALPPFLLFNYSIHLLQYIHTTIPTLEFIYFIIRYPFMLLI